MWLLPTSFLRCLNYAELLSAEPFRKRDGVKMFLKSFLDYLIVTITFQHLEQLLFN